MAVVYAIMCNWGIETAETSDCEYDELYGIYSSEDKAKIALQELVNARNEKVGMNLTFDESMLSAHDTDDECDWEEYIITEIIVDKPYLKN